MGINAKIIGHIGLAAILTAGIIGVSALQHLTGNAAMVVDTSLIAGNSIHGISLGYGNLKLGTDQAAK